MTWTTHTASMGKVTTIEDENRQPVCRMVDENDHRRAALIAAAPDMLGMLYTVLPYIEDAELDPAYKPGAVAKITAQIRELINRAEGA